MKPAAILRLVMASLCAAAFGAFAQAKLDTKLSTAPSRIVAVDRIVAVVNDEVITQNDLSERVNLVVKQLQRGGSQVPPSDVLNRQILERMINDLLQVQLAKENGIKVDDATLDKTIERIAQENNLSMPDFRSALDRDGVKYPRFREDIRQEILLSRLREREVDNAVVVTDAEVETEIAREAKEATSDSEYRLSHILVMVPQSPRRTPMRRMHCKAATSAGVLRRACRSSSSTSSTRCNPTT
jgi:peptidyl-prolyl cis-trans isomerase SurA